MVLFQYLKHTQEQHRVHAVWDVRQAMTRGQKLFIDLTIKGASLACPAPIFAKPHNGQEALH